MLPRILMVLSYAFATFCAVAASKSDLTDEPYDGIIRLSLEKPACLRCTYWRRPARHYSKAGNDARFAAGPEYVGHSPDTLRSQLQGSTNGVTRWPIRCRSQGLVLTI